MMDFPNPAINPPLLRHSSIRHSLHSRSPSRSPVRLQHFDPLLRDLSPTSTLRVFSARPGDSSSSSHPLTSSLQDATHVQRALGIKAAQTCLDVRSWTRELEMWKWPGTFDVPPAEAKANGKSQDEMWGSLPAETVRNYTRRLNEVGELLDEVDVEELKDFVLSAHGQASSAPADIDDSIGAIGEATDLRRLDDFTALITATILQTLPYLSRLQRLLNSWNLRVTILTAVPGFLRDLEQARSDLELSWKALGSSSIANDDQDLFNAQDMHSFQMIMSTQITKLGRRLDNFLDQLEGRQETVPDSWIDGFESLEAQYGDWVVHAENKLVELEWQASLAPPTPTPNAAAMESERAVLNEGHPEILTSEAALAEPEAIVSSNEDPSRDEGSLVQASSQPSEADQRRADIKAAAEFAVASMGIDPIDSVIAGSQVDENTASRPQAPTSKPHTSRYQSDNATESSDPAISSFQAPQQIRDLSENDIINQQIDPGLDFDFQDQEISDMPPAVSPVEENAAQMSTVKNRAAFFNQKLEKAGTLNKSKAPSVVRPFEHASNAFTRLFKKNLSPEHPKRGSSTSSKRSVSSQDSSRDSSRNLVEATKLRAETRSVSPLPFTASNFSAAPTQPDVGDRSPVLNEENLSQPNISTEGNEDLSAQSIPQPTSPWDAPVPETYIPTGMLSSPFHSPQKAEFSLPGDDQPGVEFPPNWPLVGDAVAQSSFHPNEIARNDGAQDDIYSTGNVIGSDAFDRAFIDNFKRNEIMQGTTVDPAASGGSSPGDMQNQLMNYEWSQNNPPPDSRLNAISMEQSNSNGNNGAPPSFSALRSIDPASRRGFPRPISTVEEEEGGIDDDATPSADGRKSSGDDTPPVPTRQLRGRSRSASVLTPLVRHVRSPSAPASGTKVVHLVQNDSIIRRANSKSIESFPISQVKQVNVVPKTSRRHSASSATFRISPGTQSADESSLPPSPGIQTPTRRPSTGNSPLFYNGQLFPTPPSQRPSLPSSPLSADDSPSLPRKWIAGDIDSNPQSPSLNGIMAKRRSKIPVTLSDEGQPSPPPAATTSTTTSSTVTAQGGDNFDRHVSAVLDRVHAPIRFRTRPGAETPAGFRQNETKAFNGLRPKTAKTAPARGASNMTLAPAEPTSRKSRPGAEDVKVYHLHTGADEPIKLFVRLVGEDERVMVRVGGGWADLADYLRQYAEHHGSRAVSEGVFEVSTMNPSTSSGIPASAVVNKALGSGSKRTVSMPVDYSTRARTPRPITPLAQAASSMSAERPRSSRGPVDRDWLQQPQPQFSMGDDDLSDADNLSNHDQQSPTPTSTTVTTYTPRSRTNTTTNTNVVARGNPTSASKLTPQPQPSADDQEVSPSTVVTDTRMHTTSSGSTATTTTTTFSSMTNSNTNSSSLAGPGSAKKAAELDEMKARWVEDMLGRAKADKRLAGSGSGSAEDEVVTGGAGGNGKAASFGEMGRVGGTRRVVFKKGGIGSSGV